MLGKLLRLLLRFFRPSPPKLKVISLREVRELHLRAVTTE